MDRAKLQRFEELSEKLARARQDKAEKRPTFIMIDEEDGTFQVSYSDETHALITEAEAAEIRRDCRVVTMRIVTDKPPERRN